MVKGIVTGIFVIFTLLALTIIFMSTGYFLIVFIVVIPPAMILHFLAWYRSKGHPGLYGWIILSSAIFLIFSLLRFDKDANGIYNGYQRVLYQIGKIESPPDGPLAYSLEMSLMLLLGMIILDAIILRRAVRKNN